MKLFFVILFRFIATIILYTMYIPRFIVRLLECMWYFNLGNDIV